MLVTNKQLYDEPTVIAMLNLFLRRGGQYAPGWIYAESLTGNRNRRFQLPASLDLLREAVPKREFPDDIGTIAFHGKGRFSRTMDVLEITRFGTNVYSGKPTGPNYVRVSIDEQYFAGPEETKRVEEHLNLAVELYDLTEPFYGYCHQLTDRGYEISPPESIADSAWMGVAGNWFRLRRIAWANFFGPEWVDILGRDRLATTPAWRVQELADGGFLVVVSPSPLEPGSVENRRAQEAVARHLDCAHCTLGDDTVAWVHRPRRKEKPHR